MIGGLPVGITKPVRLSLPKQIADEIEKGIKNGSWEVGSKIPSEPEMVNVFGVSRNTIREAVQSLIHAGVLEARQGDGTYVRASGPFEANMIRRLSDSDMHEVHEVRLSLEKDIVRLAAERRTDADLESIRDALEKRNAEKRTVKENTEADIAFHTAVARASHNGIFYDLYKYVSEFIARSIQHKVAFHNLEGDKVDDLHRELFDAILEKDPDKAEKTIVELLNI